jgi:hypothetical protein
MKVIFLDIDGPMIPYRAMFLPGQTKVMTVFDPVAVSLLNALCDQNGYKIVLHSSWIRIMGGQFTKEHCITQGIKAEHFHSDAFCNEDINWRYTRVAEWLSRHPEVEKYVMLDDDPYQDDLHGAWPHPEGMSLRLILVNYYAGMLFHEFNEVQAKLKDEYEGGVYADLSDEPG